MFPKSDFTYTEKKDIGSFVTKLCYVVILLLSVLACVKTIFVSLDIDESYAIAVGYRLATGDRFFKDLWEAHQLGGFFIAPFLRFFLMMTGSTSYIVVYARILGTLFHLGIGLYLYFTLKDRFSREIRLLLFFIHLNFLPKWVQIPEFELQQYWFILLQFLFLYRFFMRKHGKRRYLVLAGFMIFLQMFSYPTLILLYPYIALCIWCFDKKNKKSIRNCIVDILCFTLGALIPGLIFIGYLFSYMSLADFQRYVSYMFQDESHTLVSTSDKWKIFFADFCQILKDSVWAILIAVFLLLLRCVVQNRKKEKNGIQNKSSQNRGEKNYSVMENAIYMFVCTVAMLLSLEQVYGCLFGNENQFYMLWRFFIIACMGFLLLWVKRDRLNCVISCFAIVPGFLVLLSVMIMTNMDINTSMAKMFISVLGVFLILASWVQDCETEDIVRRESALQVSGPENKESWKKWWLLRGTMFAFLLGLLVCKLILMRVSGCLEITVLAPLDKIELGPAAGIYMVEDTATVLKEDYQVLTDILTGEDKLLYVGSENIVYLWTDAQVSTPSTQGTNAYNEMFPQYFAEFPEKMPTVIAVDKELGVNPVYYNSPQNHILYEWIEEDFGYTEKMETGYMTLYLNR